MKKIFVIYASAGQGHTKAAQVVHRYLAEKEKGADIRLIDGLNHSSALLKASYGKGYDFVIRHAQWLWFFIFYGSSIPLPFGLSRVINRLLNRANASGLYRFLEKEQPDIIISTHFLPCQVAAELKARGKIHSCLVTVITDFGVHPYWVASETDLYAVASASTGILLERMGVKRERICVTGIPVAPARPGTGDRASLRAELGLDPAAFTVLLATGSFGIGPLEHIARLLNSQCQVIVVCAKNARLFERLTRLRLPNVRVYGFVQNMHELMSASDLMVTKPGGLSVSELLVQETVPILIAAIPGQESGNVAALLKEGIGTYCRTPRAVKAAVLDFKEHPEKLQAVRDAIAAVRKPRSAEEIWNAIRAYCSGTAS